jgi:hypothetical protein
MVRIPFDPRRPALCYPTPPISVPPPDLFRPAARHGHAALAGLGPLSTDRRAGPPTPLPHLLTAWRHPGLAPLLYSMPLTPLKWVPSPLVPPFLPPPILFPIGRASTPPSSPSVSRPSRGPSRRRSSPHFDPPSPLIFPPR